MEFQDVGICITAIISIVSLFLSFANYWRNKPKIKIQITDKKWDCFFGKVIHDERITFESYICGAKINIVNNSPVAIAISSCDMIVNKQKLKLINNEIELWENISFFFERNGSEWTTDGSYIDYKKDGLSVPLKVNAYDAITAYVFFYNFPVKIKSKCKGKIVLNTAVGKIAKSVKLIEYDDDYMEEGYRDYLQSCESLKE